MEEKEISEKSVEYAKITATAYAEMISYMKDNVKVGEKNAD